MEHDTTPVINLRTILFWESITGKSIANFNSSDNNDMENMKYSVYVSNVSKIPFGSFKLYYGSYDFKNEFDCGFNSALSFFMTYGYNLFTKYTTVELIDLLVSQYGIDYETIVSSMTFNEIKLLIEKKYKN